MPGVDCMEAWTHMRPPASRTEVKYTRRGEHLELAFVFRPATLRIARSIEYDTTKPIEYIEYNMCYIYCLAAGPASASDPFCPRTRGGLMRSLTALAR